MKDNRLKISKQQLLELFGDKYINVSVKIEFSKNNSNQEYIDDSVALFENTIIFYKYDSSKEDYILMRCWKKDSEGSNEVKLMDKECNYYLEFNNSLNLFTLIIIEDLLEVDKEGISRKEHFITFYN